MFLKKMKFRKRVLQGIKYCIGFESCGQYIIKVVS